MADVDMDQVAAQIDMGRHDGDLSAVFNAVRHRMAEGLGFEWRITLTDVLSFTEADMSFNALEAAEAASGVSWQVINPESTAREYKALVASHLKMDLGWFDEEIVDLLGSMLRDQIVDSVEWLELVNSPKG